MRNRKWLCGLLLLAGASISGLVQADRGGHGRVGLGFYFGIPYPYPYHYYPYPYYPPIVEAPAPPSVYIEQPDPQQAPSVPDNYFWYHCDKPDGYYPYIKQCPGGWQKVVPTPPPLQ